MQIFLTIFLMCVYTFSYIFFCAAEEMSSTKTESAKVVPVR